MFHHERPDTGPMSEQDPHTRLAHLIDQELAARRMSRHALGIAAGLGKNTIPDLFSGRRRTSDTTWAAIARVLG